jgi:DNA-binding GntR family transcriptional regulator
MDEQVAERGLLSDQIRNALTDEIAAGRLAAGTALDEQDLADRFGASRTPVREALRQLAFNGLVELRPRRGVVVTRMTPERIMDMFETTAEFEAMCVRLATYRMTPLERSHLMDLHARSGEMVAAGDVDAYDGLNRAFHEALYGATHNGFLKEQALALRTRLGLSPDAAAPRRSHPRLARGARGHPGGDRRGRRGSGGPAHARAHAQRRQRPAPLHRRPFGRVMQHTHERGL